MKVEEKEEEALVGVTPSEGVKDAVTSEVEEAGTSGRIAPDVLGKGGQRESGKEVQK